jgi:hypothetical protein
MQDQEIRVRFTLFPELSPELRWTIYEYAIPAIPDMLIFDVVNSTTNSENKTIPFNFRGVSPERSCTALLTVCKESRKIH